MNFVAVMKLRMPPILRLALALGLLLLLLCTGCRMVKGAMELPGQAIQSMQLGKGGTVPVDPVELQEELLRFTDSFFEGLGVGFDLLQNGTNGVTPAETLPWKTALAMVSVTIATGPNPIADLLDMTIFVTVTRDALEQRWSPAVYGESAVPLLDSYRLSETNIWQLAGNVLTPKQKEELRQATQQWRRENPNPESALAARALGFAAEIAKTKKVNQPGADPSTSVFTLLKLDPLSGLDPTMREVAQTRLFGERALYVALKTPILVRWQTELLTFNAMAQPAMRQLVTNSTELAASTERFARVAEQLPGQVATERKAILSALDSQSKNLTGLAAEIKETLTAGSQMSTSLNTTLITFDALMQRVGVGETNAAAPPDPNAPPFNILDYAKTAAQLGATAQQLTELLQTLDQTTGSNNLGRISAQLAPVLQQAQTGGKEVVDYAFWKGILLVLIALVAALIYRLLAARMPTANSKSKVP